MGSVEPAPQRDFITDPERPAVRRFLAGDRGVFARLEGKLPAFLVKQGQKLARHLCQLTRGRHEKFNHTLFHLEPDVKETTGGLRDLHFVSWIAKLRPELGAYAPLDSATAFLSSLRCFLHYEAGRDRNVLDFDSQEKIAQWVYENVRIPARRYWDHIMLNMVHELVESGVEPWAGLSKAAPDELIPLFQPFGVNVVVAGGETNGHFSIFQGAQMPPAFRSDPNVPLLSPVDPWR